MDNEIEIYTKGDLPFKTSSSVLEKNIISGIDYLSNGVRFETSTTEVFVPYFNIRYITETPQKD